MNLCQIKCDFQQIWRTICNSLPKNNDFRVIWQTFRNSLPNNREIQIIWQSYEHKKKELGNNSSSYFLYEYLFRKRAPKGSPDVHFTNNAQMVDAHPALIRSSGSGLSAFCPTLF